MLNLDRRVGLLVEFRRINKGLQRMNEIKELRERDFIGISIIHIFGFMELESKGIKWEKKVAYQRLERWVEDKGNYERLQTFGSR